MCITAATLHEQIANELQENNWEHTLEKLKRIEEHKRAELWNLALCVEGKAQQTESTEVE